jgi:hypothetical protein
MPGQAPATRRDQARSGYHPPAVKSVAQSGWKEQPKIAECGTAIWFFAEFSNLGRSLQ